MALLDDIRKSQYLSLLGDKLQGLLDVPTSAARFMVNPTGVLESVTGKTAMPREKGFAESVTGLPQRENMSVLDPNNRAYMAGYFEGEPYGLAAMAAPSLYGAARVATNPRTYAGYARPFYSPQVSTEAAQTPTRTLLEAAGDPIAEGLSRRRFELGATDPLKKNVEYRQGVWEAESNPMYLSTMPRTMGALSENPELIRNVVQSAENLEQAGAGVIRAIPLPMTNNLAKGDVAILSNNGKAFSGKEISELSKVIAGRGAIQHRADGSAVLMSFGDDLTGLVQEAKKDLPSLRARPAISEEGIDRLYFERPEYQGLGAISREANPAIKDLINFDELLRVMNYRE